MATTPSEIPSPLRIGEFVVDPGLNSLTGPGGVSVLETKIMEVLLCLARRQGETVSQEELLAAVWEGKFVVEAVVTRAISELRKAFGDDSKAPRYIQTVARRGYRLIAEVASVEAPGRLQSAIPPKVPLAAPAVVQATAGPGGQLAGMRSARGRWTLLAGLLVVAGAAAVAGLFWTARSPVPPGVDTPPEAFRLYAQAQKALAGGSCVAHQAIVDLERALALAPTFAPAWEQYGWAKYNLVSSCGESGAAYGDALRAAERALELAPASTQALALKIAVLAETGRAEEAWELGAPRVGESPQIAFLAAYAATYGGALERARGLIEEVARRDAGFFAREGWTPNALLYLATPDDVARFLTLLPEGATPLVRFYRGYALWRSGRPAEAAQELGPAFLERPTDPFARLAEALVAEIEGRNDDARLLLGQLALQRTRLAASDGELTFRVAELLAGAGDSERSLVEAERALGQGFFCSRCFATAPAFAGVSHEPRFAAIVGRAKRREAAFAATIAGRPPADAAPR
ncbi:MAG: winged helix-turn-helix domain-containing protein [Thermoanaerobaculia bacterium]